MASLVHRAAGKLPSAEITFCRSFLMLVAVTPLAWKEVPALFRSGSGKVWVRSVAYCLSVLCLAWNLQHTSVGFANVLLDTGTFAVLLLGLITGAIPRRIIPIFCMVLVAAGSCLCWAGAPVTPALSVWAVGLAGAIFLAIGYTMIERQSRDWSNAAIIWPLGLMSLPFSLALNPDPWVPLTASTLLPLLAIAALGLFGQALRIVSLRNAGLAIGTALIPSAVGFGVLIDTVLSRRANSITLIGCVVYLAGLMPLLALRSSQGEPPSAAGDQAEDSSPRAASG